MAENLNGITYFLIALYCVAVSRALIRKAMEERNVWAFSCYSYAKEMACMPGLIELSPEEVRLLAYTANSAGTYPNFVQNMEEVRRKQADMSAQYAQITPEEVNKLVCKENSNNLLANI